MRTHAGMKHMLQVFCIATTEAEAEGVVSRILDMGIRRENIFVAAGFSEMDQIAVPIRELRRHVWIGLGLRLPAGLSVYPAIDSQNPETSPQGI